MSFLLLVPQALVGWTLRVLLTALLVITGSAFGMQFETRGSMLFASGEIHDDVPAFTAALQNPNIKTLVLVNSPGGIIETALAIGRLVASRKLDTVVAGYCISACTVIFVRGVNRSFADAWSAKQTFLGIHGPHDGATKKLAPDAAVKLFDYYKLWLGENFDAVLFNRALYDMEDAGSLLKIYDPVRSPDTPPEHCPSQFKPDVNCTKFNDQSAFSLGLVTQKELVTIALPESLSGRTKVVGIELTAPLTHLGSFLAKADSSYCTHIECRDTLKQYNDAEPFSALAFAKGQSYAAYANQKDDPTDAFMDAMSACNYPSPSITQLCEAQVVNGMDMRALYQDADRHAKALQALVVPIPKYFAGESAVSHFTHNGPPKSMIGPSPTPGALGGITTMYTQALALALQSPTPPQIVAVAALEGKTLPQAQWFEQSGVAYDVPVVEQELEKRFNRMLRLLAPHTDQPVVFYCLGPDSWLSVNAALRAKKIGYRQIFWYRGGLAAWQAAKLPTVTQAPRAVLSIQ